MKCGYKVYDEVLSELAETLKRGLRIQPQIDTAQVRNYGVMRERLIPELIPTKGNEEMLRNIPHRQIEDMSLIYRVEYPKMNGEEGNERQNPLRMRFVTILFN